MRGVCWIVLGFEAGGYCNSTGCILLMNKGLAFIVSVQRLYNISHMYLLVVTTICITTWFYNATIIIYYTDDFP